MPAPPAQTFAEDFRSFLAAVYHEPPSPDDSHPAVREQYKQIRDAFYSGCLAGVSSSGGGYIDELLAYRDELRGRSGDRP